MVDSSDHMVAMPSSAPSTHEVEPGNAFDAAPGVEQQAGGRGPIRAAMVIQNYLPTVGGAERQLASLIPLLSTHGIESVVLTRSRPGQPPREYLRGAEVRRIRCMGPKPVEAIMFVVGALWNLARLRPDVVHTYDTLTPSLIAGLYKTVTGTPYLTKLLRSGELGDLRRLEARPLGRLRLRLLTWTVDRFVVISRDLESELERRGVGHDQRVFIPNGVDTDRFRPLDDDEVEGSLVDPHARHRSRREVLPDWTNGPVVLMVGRISPEKRVIDLARRWSEVRAEHPDAWLYVVGEGPLEGELDGLDGVRHLGKREDMPLLLRWADLYVSASEAEGLSNALLEAMASGLACVVTDVGGVGDVMTDRVDGRIVSSGSTDRTIDDIVSDTVTLLSDPDDRYALGTAARATVQHRYSIESTVNALADQYRGMAGSRE